MNRELLEPVLSIRVLVLESVRTVGVPVTLAELHVLVTAHSIVVGVAISTPMGIMIASVTSIAPVHRAN